MLILRMLALEQLLLLLTLDWILLLLTLHLTEMRWGYGMKRHERLEDCGRGVRRCCLCNG
jgi:hypothetical protein